MNTHRLKSDSTEDIVKDKHISISDQNGVTGPVLCCKQLENWTQYMKQLFSDIGQQSKTVIGAPGWRSRPDEPRTPQVSSLTLFSDHSAGKRAPRGHDSLTKLEREKWGFGKTECLNLGRSTKGRELCHESTPEILRFPLHA